MVRAVGVPLCSWRRHTSESPAACEDRTISGRMRFPRFSLIDVGSSNLISLEKALSLLEGSRAVETRTLGSTMPERAWYSSSRSISSIESGLDSS